MVELFPPERTQLTCYRVLIDTIPWGEVSGEEVIGRSILVDLSIGLHRDDDPSDLSRVVKADKLIDVRRESFK